MSAKIEHGQFFTVGNPFVHPAFQEWMTKLVGDNGYGADTTVIEPFAGANNIIRLMNEAGFGFFSWGCYDIDPPHFSQNTVPEFNVVQQDVLRDYPQGYRIAVTNPPYLAKNSAKRKGYNISFGELQDLYQVSVETMLENNDYIAAIIPESFITSRAAARLRKRCSVFISLTSEMFDDTDHPVCLALFDAEESADIAVYSGERYVGALSTVAQKTEKELSGDTQRVQEAFSIRFNDPGGELGFRGIDNTKADSISFVPGSEIPAEDIKPTSRSLSRISITEKSAAASASLFDTLAAHTDVGTDIDYVRLIADANDLVSRYRDASDDVLMTSFKGLRADGKYRRRMEFSTARRIIELALAKQL